MGEHLSILVVEDHADSLRMLGVFLKHLGHHCELAYDADAALAIAASVCFDVLLTDVHMPGADAWTLVRKLRERGQLPGLLISMSAGIASNESSRSKAAGCHAHLVKPFKIEELEAILV